MEGEAAQQPQHKERSNCSFPPPSGFFHLFPSARPPTRRSGHTTGHVHVRKYSQHWPLLARERLAKERAVVMAPVGILRERKLTGKYSSKAPNKMVSSRTRPDVRTLCRRKAQEEIKSKRRRSLSQEAPKPWR